MPGLARAQLAILAVLAAAGIVLGWNKGKLPQREAIAVVTPAGGNGATAPDLQLYREIIAEVRRGRGYYDAAREKIPQFGFPVSSPLNWRLPTYAWLFSLLPGPAWIQAALVGLSIVALGLAFVAQSRLYGAGKAAVTTFLLVGVVRWAIDGEAYLAQEPWAATLMVISLGAHGVAGVKRNERESWKAGERESGSEGGWRWLAVAAGIAALLFRELALPYCGIALLVAAWNRRWKEAAAWAAGIALFIAFFAWHVGQVRAQLAGSEVAGSAEIAQWLRFGGLDFILLTTRMNGLLFGAPGWLLWLYLLASLIGLSRQRDETSRLACLAALAYLVAFAVVGRPENFYWGLMPAPLLAWGVAHGPRAIAESWAAASGRTTCQLADSQAWCVTSGEERSSK